MFPDGYRNETQVIATVLSHDLENDPDIVAMVASSAALTLSGIPFMGPVGAARVGLINGALKINPTLEAAIMKCIESEPDNRFQSMANYLNAIRRLKHEDAA